MVWQRGPASFSPSIEHRWILKILTLVCCLSTLETLGSSVEKLQLELCLTCGRHCFGVFCALQCWWVMDHLHFISLTMNYCVSVVWHGSDRCWGVFEAQVSSQDPSASEWVFLCLGLLLPRVSVGFRSGEWADTTIDDQQTILKTIKIPEFKVF